jgi:hypothetical protein
MVEGTRLRILRWGMYVQKHLALTWWRVRKWCQTVIWVVETSDTENTGRLSGMEQDAKIRILRWGSYIQKGVEHVCMCTVHTNFCVSYTSYSSYLMWFAVLLHLYLPHTHTTDTYINNWFLRIARYLLHSLTYFTLIVTGSGSILVSNNTATYILCPLCIYIFLFWTCQLSVLIYFNYHFNFHSVFIFILDSIYIHSHAFYC